MSGAALDNQSAELFGPTPSQTVGPFFHYALPWKGGADLIEPSDLGARPDLFPGEHDLLHRSEGRKRPAGEKIEIAGRVTDGEGQPVPDALIEIWQADSFGRYDGEFIGFGRSATGDDGEFLFRTIRPGSAAPLGDDRLAPHIAVSVFARGLLRRLVTRIYFADEKANDSDPVLSLVPADRRDTLIATADGDGRWRFDIRLQGERETLFFAL